MKNINDDFFRFRFSSSIHYLQMFREMEVSIVRVNLREKEERESEREGERRGGRERGISCVPGSRGSECYHLSYDTVMHRW